MIALASDFLVFQLANGERVPFSAEMISVELLGDTAQWFDAEFVKHAAKAVFHYFKHDLDREFVTISEFAQALETVLRGFKPNQPVESTPECPAHPGVAESDLCRLARESADGCELFFFPRLRDELREQLRHAPRILRFRGLRSCVKQLTGARRWTPRCQDLEEQIVSFLRECLGVEARTSAFALVVE
ncbi:MAG TPA: hypothetical protein VEC99_15315 [Clostridia bacterium]|nr:hypothetical protein [Clostridia bacterium]